MPPHRARSHTGFQLQLSLLVLEITQMYREEICPEEPRSASPGTRRGECKQAVPCAGARERAVKSESTCTGMKEQMNEVMHE